MLKSHSTAGPRLLLSAAAAALATLCPPSAPAADAAAQLRERVQEWRAQRLARLTSENGWLTLVALHELDPGATTFGRAAGSGFRLDHAALPARAGTFTLRGGKVSFTAEPGQGITHEGRPVGTIEMQPDVSGAPTTLAVASLRFFVLERGRQRYVRVRDVEHPLRRSFPGLEYFPISAEWLIEARFERYEPERRLAIVDVLGEEREMTAPGALVFEKDGREWRLDAALETPGDEQLFVMFADATSGRETYGGGRYLYVPLPVNGKVVVDFNRAYNPPCVFSDFATCPLPPWQNRLALRIEAGELAWRRR